MLLENGSMAILSQVMLTALHILSFRGWLFREGLLAISLDINNNDDKY